MISSITVSATVVIAHNFGAVAMKPLHRLDIPMDEPSEEFLCCWEAAADHLSSVHTNHPGRFINTTPYPPMLEHFCFVLGNQIFS